MKKPRLFATLDFTDIQKHSIILVMTNYEAGDTPGNDGDGFIDDPLAIGQVGLLPVRMDRLLQKLDPHVPAFQKINALVNVRLAEDQARLRAGIPASPESVRSFITRLKIDPPISIVGFEEIGLDYIERLNLTEENYRHEIISLFRNIPGSPDEVSPDDLIRTSDFMNEKLRVSLELLYAQSILLSHGINETDISVLIKSGEEADIKRLTYLAEALLLEITQPYASYLQGLAAEGKRTFINDAEEVIQQIFSTREDIEKVLKAAEGNIDWAIANLPPIYRQMIIDYFAQRAADEEFDTHPDDPEIRDIMEGF